MRNAEKAKLLETKFHVKAAIGSLEDLEQLTELVEKAHVVIHTVSMRLGIWENTYSETLQQADADNEAALKAINAGLKKRHEKLGDTPILIHTVCSLILTRLSHSHSYV